MRNSISLSTSGDKKAVPPQDDPLRREVATLNLGSVAHHSPGADLERAGRLDEAIAEQQAALRVDPSAVQAHVNLDRALWQGWADSTRP